VRGKHNEKEEIRERKKEKKEMRFWSGRGLWRGGKEAEIQWQQKVWNGKSTYTRTLQSARCTLPFIYLLSSFFLFHHPHRSTWILDAQNVRAALLPMSYAQANRIFTAPYKSMKSLGLSVDSVRRTAVKI
jgi:hypothetical protein